MEIYTLMKIRFNKYLSIAAGLTLLAGCVLVSDEAADKKKAENSAPVVVVEPSPQERAQNNVEEYIKKKFGTSLTYKNYNFGELFRIKKAEQKQLDELVELRNLVPEMKNHYGNKTDSVLAHYDTLIAQKQREIKAKNIKSDYIISHVFTMKKSSGEGSVYETDFILNDQLEVKDLRMKMAVELDKDDFDWFYYFFQKYPLFNSGDYDKDVAMSNNLYDYYNNRLAFLKDGKDEFLKTALRVTRIVHKTKKFDPNVICGFVVMKKLDERKNCENYRPVKFTTAEEIKVKTTTNDSLIGYKIMHKFTCQSKSTDLETKAVYAELDPYFVPAGIIPVESPFDKYFKE